MQHETIEPNLSDPLLWPFQLKGLHLRNRVISTAHASGMDDQGMPLERYRAYHARKARGGLAMTMIGGSAMVSGDSTWGGGQLNMATDKVIAPLSLLAEAVHAEGAAVMTQISHLGRRAHFEMGNWLPVLAPSRLRESRNRSFPVEMTREDIDRVVKDYAQAALRAKEAGLDGLETLTGGHLIGQFLSPRTNRRSDEFGGSLQNRARFGLMVHEAIRKAVGDDMPVGIRFVVSEGVADGMAMDDGIAAAQLFERAGTIDFVNCIYGLMDSDLALSEDNMPGMFQKSAPYLDHIAQFRREIGLPMIHAGGIREVATGRHAIRENLVDLVGMTRAHLADPDLVRKLQAGREDEIRPCIGTSYCLLRKSHCIHNPATTRELTLGHEVPRADVPGHVMVIGGGPAGLEAARVAALRGHRVTLLEAAAQLGGQLRMAAQVRERADLIGIVDWRMAEIERLGVTVRLNVFADAADILAEKPDTVIVATGGLPDLEWLDGWENCQSTWDVIGAPAPAGTDVIVWDGTGRQAAASAVFELIRQGRSVTFVTPDDASMVEMPYQDRSGFRKRFKQAGVAVRTDLRLVSVGKAGNRMEAVFKDTYTEDETRIEADAVIVEHGTVPFQDVFDELRGASANHGQTDHTALLSPASGAAPLAAKSGFALHRIGDAVASRDIHASILDAYRLARLV